MYFGSEFLSALNHFKKVRAICHSINEMETGLSQLSQSSGAVTGDSEKKKWTITDQSILSNDPRSLCKSQLAPVTLFFF